MNGPLSDRLYSLLPELYRWRDESHAGTLKALLSVIEQELATLEADVEAMSDNWFIQTCDDWVVPYIADLLGVRKTAHGEQMPFTQRRYVANTLAYRRRKGTIAVLEQVAWDVTNWHVSAREGHQQVAVTRHLHHPAVAARGMVDLRRDVAVAGIADPLSSVLHTVEVRNTVAKWTDQSADESAAGQENGQSLPARYGMENVALYFWRLRSYPVLRSPACRVEQQIGGVADGWYTFSPDGRDLPLFTVPQSFRSIAQRAGRVNLPAPLTRRALDADLRTHRAAPVSDSADSEREAVVWPLASDYYGPGRSLNIVVKDQAGNDQPLYPMQIMSGDLSRPRPAAAVANSDGLTAIVDPELGRLALYGDVPVGPDGVARVLVDYAYGFSGDIGGGPYARRYTPDRAAGPICEINVITGCEQSLASGDLSDGILTAGSLAYALGLWTAYCEAVAGDVDVKPRGLIRILDNGCYRLGSDTEYGGGVDAIWLPDGGELAIVADNGVQPTIGYTGEPAVQVVFANPRWRSRTIPEVAANVTFDFAAATPPRVADRALYLGGLRLLVPLVFDEGNASINTVDVRVEDCRLLGGIQATRATHAHALQLMIANSICGALQLPGEIAGLSIRDSIVDRGLHQPPEAATYAIVCAQPSDDERHRPAIVIERSTIFGRVLLRALDRADTVLFASTVEVQDAQAGLVRYCYVPAGSQTPPCQHCLHEDGGTAKCEQCKPAVGKPIFTSRRYEQPGYAQLGAQTPGSFHTITGDCGEIGVFHGLYRLQREANLRDVLEHYLPLGFRAGIFYVT